MFQMSAIAASSKRRRWRRRRRRRRLRGLGGLVETEKKQNLLLLLLLPPCFHISLSPKKRKIKLWEIGHFFFVVAELLTRPEPSNATCVKKSEREASWVMRNFFFFLFLTEMLKNKRSKMSCCWRRRTRRKAIPYHNHQNAPMLWEKNKLTAADGLSLVFLLEKLRVSTWKNVAIKCNGGRNGLLLGIKLMFNTAENWVVLFFIQAISWVSDWNGLVFLLIIWFNVANNRSSRAFIELVFLVSDRVTGTWW